LEVGEAQRLKSLDDENRRLEQLVADLSLDKPSRRSYKKRLELTGLREDVAFVREPFHISERRACKFRSRVLAN